MFQVSEEGSYEDNFYFYGAVHKDSFLFALNLSKKRNFWMNGRQFFIESMNWTKITQGSNFPEKKK